MKKENILGVNVSAMSYNQLTQNAKEIIQENGKAFIVAINPEKVLKAKQDEKLRQLLNNATYQIPDGIGIVYASKLQGGNIKSRITGIDSMELLCDLSQKEGYKIFLYGAKKETILKAKKALEERYNGIKIVGYIDGYEKNNQKIIDTINSSMANIIFVALGSPKQELWITENMNHLNVNIYQGVGGSFDVLSGDIKRAPKWMQKFGLEWFYRLLKEPKRIYRQFKLIKFLWLIIFRKKDIK